MFPLPPWCDFDQGGTNNNYALKAIRKKPLLLIHAWTHLLHSQDVICLMVNSSERCCNQVVDLLIAETVVNATNSKKHNSTFSVSSCCFFFFFKLASLLLFHLQLMSFHILREKLIFLKSILCHVRWWCRLRYCSDCFEQEVEFYVVNTDWV